MANDQLRRTIEEAGLDINELAAQAGVDPKTPQRWIQGRIPHPRHRQLAAQLLGRSEYDLWPDQRRQRDRIGEVIGAYPRRSDANVPDWQTLMRAARRQIDLLGYTLLEVVQTPGIGELLAAKSSGGVPVRIAIAAGNSEQAAGADGEHRPPGQLLRRLRDSSERLAPLAAARGVQIREHHTGTSHTILRFDEQMLVTIHLYGTPGFQAPLLHLHRQRDFGVFDQLAKHLEDVWASATPIAGEPDDPVAAGRVDDSLDELDYVWRPAR